MSDSRSLYQSRVGCVFPFNGAAPANKVQRVKCAAAAISELRCTDDVPHVSRVKVA